MARRLQVGWLGVAALGLSGCFQYHDAEEAELELPPIAVDDGGALPLEPSDAGVAPSPTDAATDMRPGRDCSALPDPLQQLLCRATQQGTTGGAGDLGDLLGDLLGGARRDAGSGTPPVSIEDILDDIVRGRDAGTGMNPPPGQTGSLDCRNPADAFTRILCNARRDGGTPSTQPRDPLGALFEALSQADCDGATEQQGLTQFVCFLRDLTLGLNRGDAGLSFPGRPRGQQGQ